MQNVLALRSDHSFGGGRTGRRISMAIPFGIDLRRGTLSDEHPVDGPDHASDREQSLNIVVFEEVFPRKKQNLYAVGAVIGWIIRCT